MTTLKSILSDLPSFGAKPSKGIQSYPKVEKCAQKPKKGYSSLRKVGVKRAKEKKVKSEMDVFNEIWIERKHFSELTGEPLPYPKGHSMWHHQFIHVVNKGRSPKLRLNKRNIMLAKREEHDHQDNYPVFVERKEEILLSLYGGKSRKH